VARHRQTSKPSTQGRISQKSFGQNSPNRHRQTVNRLDNYAMALDKRVTMASIQNWTGKTMIAALFVEKNGPYAGLEGVDVWDESRDARLYAGPFPVVAHPPCQRWGQLANLVEARYGYPVGDDGGCFAAALASVRKWGAFSSTRPSVPGGQSTISHPRVEEDGIARTSSAAGHARSIKATMDTRPEKQLGFMRLA
jgi:hypothetical protein